MDALEKVVNSVLTVTLPKLFEDVKSVEFRKTLIRDTNIMKLDGWPSDLGSDYTIYIKTNSPSWGIGSLKRLGRFLKKEIFNLLSDIIISEDSNILVSMIIDYGDSTYDTDIITFY